MKKILAIGCGGAGMFSLIVPSQLKKGKFQTTVLSDEKNIYCRCTSPYIISGKAKLKDAIQPESMFTEYGFKIIHERAIKLDTERKVVFTNTGRALGYDYLVISTGVSPYKPDIEGIDNTNVFTVRTSDDIANIKRVAKKGNKALIIGSGIIGLEMAGALITEKVEVNVVEYNKGLSEHIADPEFADMIINHISQSGVKFSFNSGVTKIEKVTGNKLRVTVKEGNEEKKVTVNFVIVAAGIRPNLDIIKGTEIKANKRGILVNREMRTNVKDVFACGDCCLPFSAVTKDNAPSELASSAIQQAKIVGFQIASYPIRYAGATGAFAFEIQNKEYSRVGLTEVVARKKYKIVIVGRAKTTNIYNDMLKKEPLEVKLIFAGLRLRLVGYEAFGKGLISSAELSSFAIGLRLNILSMLKFNYIAHPSLTPWPFMNPIIMATEDALGTALREFKGLFKLFR